jgi:glycosyltransferase involved in cell wall biosynthesis
MITILKNWEYHNGMQNKVKENPRLLTAIIPVLNPGERIKFLNSWTQLLKPNLPILFVFVLDSSSEIEKQDFMEFFCSLKGNEFTLVEVKEGSPGGSRNAALETVKTKWVCFWDSDDIPYPETILRVLDDLGEHADVIIGNYVTLDDVNQLRQTAASSDHKVENVFTRNPGIWRMVFSADLVKGERFLRCQMAEDQFFLVKLALASRRCTFSREVFYGYIQHNLPRLTNSTAALSDFILVQRELLNLVTSQDGKDKMMTVIVLIRITISGVTRLGWSSKYRLVKSFLFFVFQPKNFAATLCAISALIRNR